MRSLSKSFLLVVSVALGGLVSVLASAPGGAASSETHVVHPGDSIQDAIDDAHAGDTVLVKAGVYRETLVVQTNDLTLRAEGKVWLKRPSEPSGLCASFGEIDGICVIPADVDPNTGAYTHRVRDVSISGFRIAGFDAMGIFAYGTKNLKVSHVRASDNGEYGIARFDGIGGSIHDSSATGSDEAGLYVGDSPKAHAVVRDNSAWDNGLGILVRHVHFATFEDNHLWANCVGIFIVDDGQPEGSGDQRVTGNAVNRNNKVCPGNAEEGLPEFSGGGVVLWGSTDNVIRDNEVNGNRGDTVVSGGILLQKSPFSDKGSDGNLVAGNEAEHNDPADIIQDKDSTGNHFSDNDCGTSDPSGLC